jgi:hypothetical protein
METAANHEPSSDLLAAMREDAAEWKKVEDSLGEDACARKTSELLTNAVAEIERLRTINRSACEEWAADHTHLQNLCRAVGRAEHEVEGDSYYVPSISELADMLYCENKRLRDIIRRAEIAFCKDGSDGEVAASMFSILTKAHYPKNLDVSITLERTQTY